MTSTDPNEIPRPERSSLELQVTVIDTGDAVIKVSWSSDSPWVPGGSMTLSTAWDRISSMGYKAVVEGIIIQLRPVLQAMVSEAWPPF